MKYVAIILGSCIGILCGEDENVLKRSDEISIQPTAFLGYNSLYNIEISVGALCGMEVEQKKVGSLFGLGPEMELFPKGYSIGGQIGYGIFNNDDGAGVRGSIVLIYNLVKFERTETRNNGKRLARQIKLRSGITGGAATICGEVAWFWNDEKSNGFALGIGAGF